MRLCRRWRRSGLQSWGRGVAREGHRSDADKDRPRLPSTAEEPLIVCHHLSPVGVFLTVTHKARVVLLTEWERVLIAVGYRVSTAEVRTMISNLSCGCGVASASLDDPEAAPRRCRGTETRRPRPAPAPTRRGSHPQGCRPTESTPWGIFGHKCVKPARSRGRDVRVFGVEGSRASMTVLPSHRALVHRVACTIFRGLHWSIELISLRDDAGFGCC